MHPRRSGRPAATTSIDEARRLRKAMTPAEARIWLALRQLRDQGHHFRRQVPIDRYIVDFAALKHRLVVEIDGGHHGFDGEAVRDQRRDATLARLGFRVLRFWNAEVFENLDGVVETILAAARERIARATPP
ncbi:MAG: endonuclease domain-containing protein [Microvirga sp.]|nr:endonuclease domain-containing protein [Microvirga sp.]